MSGDYNKRMEFVPFAAADNRFYLGDLSIAIISDPTYDWMWKNLLLSLRFDKEDFVMEHCEAAEQAGYHLREGLVAHRIKFLEFHHALGALVLQQKRYLLLKRFFDYTRSEPPQYELLPVMMG